MLNALFALILIPVGLNGLGFRLPYDHCWHMDGAPLSFFSDVFCVIDGIASSVGSSCVYPDRGGCGCIRLNAQLTRIRRPEFEPQIRDPWGGI